jgi:uncharacterized low-complexity protein
MNRKVARTLFVAALFASASASVALVGAQTAQNAQTTQNAQATQKEQPALPKIERTGRKQTKVAQSSCPIHPDVKARTPGKCPKCRAEDRKQKEAQQKERDRQKESGVEVVNE